MVKCKVHHHEVRIIVEKEKWNIFVALKKVALDKNATIFGGMVRDEIISQHHREEFRKHIKKLDNSTDVRKNFQQLFWDTTFHPETSARTLVPNDMDVFFPTQKDAEEFADSIKCMPFDSVVIDETTYHTGYANTLLGTNKIHIKFFSGRTFTFKGILIEIELDCLHRSSLYPQCVSDDIEPPFNNLDFICNVFINTKEGIRMSRNTGTALDVMTVIERTRVSLGIMKQMVNFETELCTCLENNPHEDRIVSRIVKMCCKSRNAMWKFNNLPYIIDAITEEDRTNKNVCIICQDDIYKLGVDEKVVFKSSTSTGEEITSCMLHAECMNSYLRHQCKNPNGRFTCPLKSQIKFVGIVPDFNKY